MDKETKQQFNKIGKRFDKQDKKFEDILKFLYKEMPAKSDLGKLADKEELSGAKSQILTSVDGLAKQIQTYH